MSALPAKVVIPAEAGIQGALVPRLRGGGFAGRWRGLVLPLAAIGAWWLVASRGAVVSALLVSPAEVAATASEQVTTGHLWRARGASLAGEAIGFAIGTVAGLLLGALLGLSPLFNRLVGPSFNTFKQSALFAW